MIFEGGAANLSGAGAIQLEEGVSISAKVLLPPTPAPAESKSAIVVTPERVLEVAAITVTEMGTGSGADVGTAPMAATDTQNVSANSLKVVALPFITNQVPTIGVLAPEKRSGSNMEAITNVYVVMAGACQPMMLGGDVNNALIIGAAGTIIWPEKDNSLMLRQGRVVALVGKDPISVSTRYGDVRMAPNCTVIVQQTSRGVLSASNVSDKAVSMQITRDGKTETLTADAGEELVVADDSLADEELIAVDGVEREPIAGVVKIPGMKIAKSKINVQMMLDREPLIVCNFGTFSVVQRRMKNLKHGDTRPAISLNRNDAGAATSFDSLLSRSAGIGSTSVAQAIRLRGDQAPLVPADASGSAGIAPPAVKRAPGNAPSDPSANVRRTDLMPIAYRAPAAVPSTDSGVQTISSASALLKHNGHADATVDKTSGAITLTAGELLVAAGRDTMIKAGASTIYVKSGALALISRQQDLLKVRALWENSTGSIRQHVGKQCWNIAAGQETVLGTTKAAIAGVVSGDQIGRRRARIIELAGGFAMYRSEISLPALMVGVDFLNQICRSKSATDRLIAGKIFKMAAALNQATASHGNYGLLQMKD